MNRRRKGSRRTYWLSVRKPVSTQITCTAFKAPY